ncbi:DNA adenine methylase [Flavobacterium anhuiense]|uniref:DNA adenine methylase n=1 Tax=Flavobacterium anhuiense TaxID=459526 RepID=UPI000E6C2448|nr:Dam family site-specific DNA-(adenine-N6)-methyltransferase [Flavobacterium anhuiense]
MTISKTTTTVQPFLRWTGSKRWLLKEGIDNFLPKSINNYHEPFLGGGAMFFHLKSSDKYDIKKFYISDFNKDLINTYSQLRDNADEVINQLKKYKNTSEDYYALRSYKPEDPVEIAAQFIFLNRTSFNGIYRVNSQGIYNVPYGKRPNVDFVTHDLLMSTNNLLKDVSIDCYDFENIYDNLSENDFVFLDPPYSVAHENNGFIMYNQKLFSWDDQIRLRDFAIKLSEKKVNFIITNAYHSSILELYKNIGKMRKISRYSQVGGKVERRGNYNEVIISNY